MKILVVKLTIGKSKVLCKECLYPVKHMLYLALAVGIRVKWVDWRHDVVQFQTAFRNVATLECHLDELYSLVALQMLFCHKFFKLSLLLLVEICLPFLIDCL